MSWRLENDVAFVTEISSCCIPKIDIFEPEVVIWRDVVIIANMENPADVD